MGTISKKAAVCTLCLMLMLLTGGCWNYRGLDEMAIVAGIAIDKDNTTGIYHLTYEIVDITTSVQETGPQSKIIESEGKTIFDAARNAKKRLVNKLYFGDAQTLVLSQEIAKEEEIGSIIDWFLRDAECRETAIIVISQEETAGEILKVEGIDNAIVAFELYSIVTNDKEAVSSTANLAIYQVYNLLHSPGICIALPVFHTVINDETPVCESNGIAIFKNEKMIGSLTPEETKYFLFATNKVNGGVLALSSTGQGDHDVSLEIATNKTKISYSLEDVIPTIHIQVETDVYLDEIQADTEDYGAEQLKALEEAAADLVKQNMERVIKKVQDEYNADIFGFGNIIYKHDPTLWWQLSPKWEQLFPKLNVVVSTKVNIVNSASVKTI